VSQLAVKPPDHAVGTPEWNLHNSVSRQALNCRQRALSKVIVSQLVVGGRDDYHIDSVG
jgi:hypothetical protein